MSFISKDHFHMALKGVRSFLNQKADKSELDKLHEDILDEITKSGVQADWNQNDLAQPDYVRNRTHYVEGGEAAVEWDGSAEGLDVVAVGSDTTLVRVSGLLPSLDAMIGRTVELADGTAYEISAETAAQSGPVWVVYSPTADDFLPVLYGIGATTFNGVTFPATGLYAVQYQDQPYRFARVTIAYETIHRLDPKYLPEEAVREYMIELDYASTVVTDGDDQSVFGEIPNVLTYTEIRDAYASGQRLVVRLKNTDYPETYLRLVSVSDRSWTFEADMGSQYTADSIRKLYLTLHNQDMFRDTVTARVAYINVKLGGDAAQLQADWGQNDPTQPDYVKGRTHYEENNQTIIEYDGGSDGREVFPIYGGDTDKITKISDYAPTRNELIGAELIVGTAEGVQTAVLTEEVVDAILRPFANGFKIADFGVIAYDTTLTAGGDTITVPSPGIYSTTLDGGAEMYIAKLIYNSTIAHPLDEKFIPDSIARKTDIPDAVPAPATAKAGQTIMVESVDENGKPTGWKPVDVVIKNLDDITTMKETNLQCGFYYRLSDPLPDGWYYYDDTKYGSKIPTLVVINKENTAVAGTMLLNAASLMYITSSETYINVVVYAKNGGVTIYGYNLETNEADYYREAVYSTTRADYFLNQKISSPKVAEVNQLLSVKTIDENGKPIEWEVVDRTHYDDGETIKQLDEKFIPNTIARVADIPVVPVTSVNGMTGDVVIEVSGGNGSGGVSSWNDLTDKPFYEKDVEIDIQWDGVSGDIKVDIGDVPASYVSDYVLSNENLIGMTINMVTQGENNERTEETITIEPEHILAYSSDVMMVAECMLVVHRDNAELMGIQFPKAGIYFVNFDGDYISSLNGTTTILKKLENKYIDSHDSVTINLSYVYNEETDEYTDVVVNQTFVNVLNSYNNEQGIYVSVNEENNTYRYPVDVIAIGEGGIVYGVYLLFTDINGNNMALLLSMDGQIDLITSPFASSSSDLPEVTEENNGQILGVVDGSWAVTDAPSGLPEVSSTDNGKVLTVTDGTWVASEIAVTSVNGQTGDIQIDIPEVPVALPNPNTITFTGVVEATYDGSSAVSIEIPSGLPEVAAENEGAFLRIVNGVPTWVVLEIAEEGVY